MENDKKPSIIYFDIETSGFDFAEDSVSCIGFLTDDGIIQFSTSSSCDEEALLGKAITFFDTHFKDLFVSYNGEKFDFPFLQERFKKYNISFNPFSFKHLDLLPPTTENISSSKARISKDNACRRLNIYLPRTCDGYTCALIEKYRTTLSPESFYEIIIHNAVDLYALARMYHHYKKLRWIE